MLIFVIFPQQIHAFLGSLFYNFHYFIININYFEYCVKTLVTRDVVYLITIDSRTLGKKRRPSPSPSASTSIVPDGSFAHQATDTGLNDDSRDRIFVSGVVRYAAVRSIGTAFPVAGGGGYG